MSRLAWILATDRDAAVRNPDAAVRLARIACDQTGDADPMNLDVLAASLASQGRFSDATELGKKALQAPQTAHREELSRQISARLALYDKGMPYVR